MVRLAGNATQTYIVFSFVSCFQFNSFSLFMMKNIKRKRKRIGMLQQPSIETIIMKQICMNENANQLPFAIYHVYHFGNFSAVEWFFCCFGLTFRFSFIYYYDFIFDLTFPCKLMKRHKTMVASHNIVGTRISFAIRIVWRRYNNNKNTSIFQCIFHSACTMCTVHLKNVMRDDWEIEIQNNWKKATNKKKSSLNDIIDKRGLQIKKIWKILKTKKQTFVELTLKRMKIILHQIILLWERISSNKYASVGAVAMAYGKWQIKWGRQKTITITGTQMSSIQIIKKWRTKPISSLLAACR